MTDLRAKSPARGGWERRALVSGVGVDAEVWERHGLRVLSSLGVMEAPDGSGDRLPTWLVSVSREGEPMPSNQDLRRVRRDFDMREAEEDNHQDGRARMLFLVVDPARRVECECKTDETVVVRTDGYRYSVPRVPRGSGASASGSSAPATAAPGGSS